MLRLALGLKEVQRTMNQLDDNCTKIRLEKIITYTKLVMIHFYYHVYIFKPLFFLNIDIIQIVVVDFRNEGIND